MAPLVGWGQTVVNGVIETGDPVQDGRLFRDGITSDANAPKGFPGTFGLGEDFRYDTFTFFNPLATPGVARVDVLTGLGTGTGIFVSAYLDSYDPNNLALNYLGDQGSSIDNFFTFNIPGLSNFVVVVTDSVGNSTTSLPYTLTINQPFILAGAVPPGPSPAPLLLTDAGAILSANTTGVQTPRVNRAATLNAARSPARDINNRLFRARSQPPQNGIPGRTVSASNSVRYLQFAAGLGMNLRVALGMEDESDSVAESDTLAEHDETLWLSSPLVMLGGPISLASRTRNTGQGGTVAYSPVSSSAKMPLMDKVVIDPRSFNRFELFTAFDYGRYSQNDLTPEIRGFHSNTYSGSVGLEYQLTTQLLIGAAFSHYRSDSKSVAGWGGSDVEGQLGTVYATAFLGDAYLDVLYSRGWFDNVSNRNTLLGTVARGETDSSTDHVAVNAGQNYALSEEWSTGWFGGLDYTKGEIDGYSEFGGGNANLIFPNDSMESLVTRVGVHLTKRKRIGLGMLTTQGRLGWGHEHKPDSGAVSATLATSPFLLTDGATATRVGGHTAVSQGAHIGTDWLEFGLSTQLDLSEQWNVRLGYEGQYGRDNGEAHMAMIMLGYEW